MSALSDTNSINSVKRFLNLFVCFGRLNIKKQGLNAKFVCHLLHKNESKISFVFWFIWLLFKFRLIADAPGIYIQPIEKAFYNSYEILFQLFFLNCFLFLLLSDCWISVQNRFRRNVCFFFDLRHLLEMKEWLTLRRHPLCAFHIPANLLITRSSAHHSSKCSVFFEVAILVYFDCAVIVRVWWKKCIGMNQEAPFF